jgi:hypothetical protein
MFQAHLKLNQDRGVLPKFISSSTKQRSTAGWYVHFASLFCIIIYCYLLIYFTFRDDTYVVFSVFTCLMIIGGFAARVRILLEKGPSRHHILEDQKIPEKYSEIMFRQKTEAARRRERGTTGWAHPQGARAHPWPRRPVVRPSWPTSAIAPSRTLSSPKT